MHFTAEVGKPYPWISTMYPSAYSHTSVPSPLRHPWPQCVTFPAVSRAKWSLPPPPTLTSPPSLPHTQTDQIRDVPITTLTPSLLESGVTYVHILTCMHKHTHKHTNTVSHTYAFNSQWAEIESTWHTILVVYIAVNSRTETVWQVEHMHQLHVCKWKWTS